MQAPAILWFRDDLRLGDLPALHAAHKSGKPILPCYILDQTARPPGGASRWWLHHSLTALKREIANLGGKLILRRGEPVPLLLELAAATGAEIIVCSRGYTPADSALEAVLREQADKHGIAVKRFPGALLHEPEAIQNQSAEPFKVFTPFWRHCLRQEPPRPALPIPRNLLWFANGLHSDALVDWHLTPDHPNWAAHWPDLWQPGSEGASRQLDRFIEGGLAHYREGRNIPALPATSRLSPHLHFGEISVRALWHRVHEIAAAEPALADPAEAFLREIGWREFSRHLLFHFPTLPETAFKRAFEAFPWRRDATLLRAWQRGQTGYPIVDAGMRELWLTGYMHNRVRMVVASFLCKHLLLSWREGEAWFWDTLLDADLANNAASWQWVAGSGADAAPYFRIFNPVIQGSKFDGDGRYVRQWVPEIAELPDRYLHAPWEAPEGVMRAAGVVLGQNYPAPIVDHKAARAAALAAYQTIKR